MMSKEGEGYLEHVREWYEHRNNENVLLLVYEEMKQVITPINTFSAKALVMEIVTLYFSSKMLNMQTLMSCSAE